jgi:hypothetical protein
MDFPLVQVLIISFQSYIYKERNDVFADSLVCTVNHKLSHLRKVRLSNTFFYPQIVDFRFAELPGRPSLRVQHNEKAVL